MPNNFLHNCLCITFEKTLTTEDVGNVFMVDAEARFFKMPGTDEVDPFFIILVYVGRDESGFPDLAYARRSLPGFQVSAWSPTGVVNPAAVELFYDREAIFNQRADQALFPASNNLRDVPVPVADLNVQDTYAASAALPKARPIGMHRLEAQPWWDEIIVEYPLKLNLLEDVRERLHPHTPAAI